MGMFLQFVFDGIHPLHRSMDVAASLPPGKANRMSNKTVVRRKAFLFLHHTPCEKIFLPPFLAHVWPLVAWLYSCKSTMYHFAPFAILDPGL